METERVSFAVTPGLRRRFTGEQLAALGDAVGANASVELTTMQQLIVTMEANRRAEAGDAIAGMGMRVYPAGAVVKNLRVCSFCRGDEEEGYPTALALDAELAGLPVPFTLRIAYSGCPTGCAESMVQDLAVVKNKGGFELYAGGLATGTPPRIALQVADGLAEDQVIAGMKRIIVLYQEQGKKRERFWQFTERMGIEALRSACHQEGSPNNAT